MPARAFPLNSVQQLVQDANGFCQWDFSQGNPLPWIGGLAGAGVCMSLACHWIKYHAEGDSLVNRLGGVWNPHHRYYTQFNHNEYQRLVQWQQNLTRFPNWQMGFQAWVRNNNLRILSTLNVPLNMGALRDGLRQINGAYALITLSSRTSRESHAIAAYIGGYGEDACFFDPNYGEYWFQNRDDFFDFFHFFSNFVYSHNHGQRIGFDRCKIERMWTQ